MLVDWINDHTRPDEPSDPVADRRLVLAFVRSFDGSAEAGYLEAGIPVSGHDDHPPTFTDPVEEDALGVLRVVVEETLLAGFPPVDRWDRRHLNDLRPAVSSLRFEIRSAGREWKKDKNRTREERRAYQAPGAYVLRVDGALTDVVPYLVMVLLTGQGMVTLLRCGARRAGDSGERCGRFFIKTGRREFCSDNCKVRASYDHYRKRKRKPEPPQKLYRRTRIGQRVDDNQAAGLTANA